MKRCYPLWLISLTVICWCAAAPAQEQPLERIDPYLQAVLNTTASTEMIDAYLFLQNRLSAEELRQQTGGLPRKMRQREVVRLLKAHAAAYQSSVQSFLSSARAAGEAERITVLWAINAVAFRARPAVIYSLAQDFPEVEQIFYDARPQREEVLDDQGVVRRNRENGFPSNPMVINPGLTLIKAPLVWAEGDSGQGVLVANIDTGADWDHPDIVRHLWNNLGEDADGDGHTIEFNGATWMFDPGDINNVDDDNNGKVDDFIGWDFDGAGDNDPNDNNGHGTATTGIVVGDGTNGNRTGVAPGAKIMILKNDLATESQIWAAMQYAVDNGADLTTSSLSWKWNFTPKPNYPGWRAMTDVELAAGVVHTNSTGNQGNQSTPGCNNSYPIPYNISAPGNSPSAWLHPDQSTLVGGLSSVIGAGDVNAITDVISSSSGMGPAAWEATHLLCPNYPITIPPQYQDYPWSRQGPTEPDSIGLLKPDVSAPGASTTSTAPGGGYQGFGGTSGATPHVAGTVALVLSANPDLEPADVSRILQTTAVEKGAPGKDPRYGAGRIDALQAYFQALAEAGQPQPPQELTAYSDYRTPTSMLLEWQDPTHLLNGDTLLAADFHVLIYRDGALVDSVTGGTESFVDDSLVDGQFYDYQIAARVDSSGKSSAAVSAGWTAGGSPIPEAPLSFDLGGNQNQITISWESPTVNIDGTPLDDYAGVNVYQNDVLVTTFSRTSADTGQTDSDSYSPAVPGFYDWHITVVDNELPANESQPSRVLGTPISVPVSDDFSVPGEPNPGLWINSHTDVNDQSVNPPSGPYALNLNGMPVGEDMVELKPLDLSGLQGSGVFFSYSYQPQGQGNAPEPDDSLQVYFKNDLGNWVLVSFHEGTPLAPFQQEVIDIENAPNGGGSYFHGQFQVRLRSLGGAGNFPNDNWFVDDVSIDLPTGLEESAALPTTFAVSRAYPNPFNPSTTINYQLPRAGDVKLVIYNVLGQKVRTLVNQRMEAGFFKSVWNGTNDAAQPVASGIYIYRFEAGDFLKVQKMILLK